jgi:hypothetical protein
MPKFEIWLTQERTESCRLIIEAETAEAAQDKAMDGEHTWELDDVSSNTETRDVSSCERVDA